MTAFLSFCSRTATNLAVTAVSPRASITIARPTAFMTVSSSTTTTTSRAASSLNMSAADFAKKEITDNKVVIFSKSYCPFCEKTKTVFNGLNVDATIYELDEMNDGEKIQAALVDISGGQRSVPNVFIGGQHVGGNDDVQKANTTGDLKAKLERAGVSSL